MKFTSLYNQTILAGLYKSSYFTKKRILYKPLVSDQLVDIASEGFLRPKLYDEKVTFDITTVKNC
jgi:hypothetical protein